jgi:ABC-2 type transport system ATP-binding protein
LRFYQEKHKITILLTSHYMKDVAALCKRVVIVAGGLVQYDGSLAGIIDKFSGKKIVTLQFAAGDEPSNLARLGTVLDTHWPKVKISIPRTDVPRVLAETLRDYAIEDVSVEDPPLEDVIADLFHQVS